MVVEEWKDIDTYGDAFHTDAAFQIEVIFDWFDYENNCFESFADDKKEHQKLFTEKRKQLIWKTANAITNSFSGKNKSEMVMLAKLKKLLKD